MNTVRKARWGGWRLNVAALTLEHFDPDLALKEPDYEVDLEWALNSAQILDWILQVHDKEWCDARCLKGLVAALDDLIGQGVCSFGVDHPLTADELATRVAEAADVELREEVGTMGKKLPVLLAEVGRTGPEDTTECWKAWCPFCRCYHTHSPGPGHRVAHCQDGSPFRDGGYLLKLAPGARTRRGPR